MAEQASIAVSRSMRGWLAMIAAAAMGVAVFAAFLAADFPYGDTLTSMLAPYKLKLTYQSQRLSPPLGAQLTGVQLFSTNTANDEVLLQSPAVTLAPTFTALLLGRPSIRVRASLFGGTVHATLYQHGGAVELNFALDSVKLGESTQLRQLGAVWLGNLSGTGTAQISEQNFLEDHAAMTIAGNGLAVSLVQGFPAIRVGTLTGNLDLDQGTIKLNDIVAHGTDLDLKADGTIGMGDNPDDSTINLTFYLNPTQAGRDRFGFFLKLLPHEAGPDSPFNLQGNLLSPSIS